MMRVNDSHYCYVIGSNRPSDIPMMQSLIASARQCGVKTEFKAYATELVDGAITKVIPQTLVWRQHMAKVDFVADALKEFDAAVWLDSDSWFVRDPGDLSLLLRGNPIWVSMESDLNDPRGWTHVDHWWTMPSPPKPGNYLEVMRSLGCSGKKVWCTNGGMWIVSKDGCQEFVDRITSIWNQMRWRWPAMADEPPLAVVGQTMVTNPELNEFANHSHVWATDWIGNWREKLPDGSEWEYTDWQTGDKSIVNPAIVHNMRGKHLQVNWWRDNH